MPRGNRSSKQNELIQILEQIKTLVNECILKVSHTLQKPHGLPQSIKKQKLSTPQLNFNLNDRAFIKKYAKPLSGPKKFVLILAYLSKGQISKEISLDNIRKMWGSMSGLLDLEFNLAYSIRAKDNGWINPVKRGFYVLTDSWKEIFAYE